jgi:hypothetical protein
MIQLVAGIVKRCMQQSLSARVSFETGRRTDVVILNAASVETAYQVITTGELLYEKDAADRLEYENESLHGELS